MGNPNEENNKEAQPEDLMGYELSKAPEVTLPETSNAPDAQAQINEAVKQVTVGEDGKYVYPVGMDPMLKAAVAASKSFRDTQSGYHKQGQSLKASEAENAALREKLAESIKQPLELTPTRQAELDALMFTNPQLWRQEMNKLDQQSSIEATERLAELTERARTDASGQYELERRIEVLNQFNVGRDTELTDEILTNDVPRRITQKLADGIVTFEDYLDEASLYLSKGKVVANANVNTTVDLNKANGSGTLAPSEEQGKIDYSQTAF